MKLADRIIELVEGSSLAEDLKKKELMDKCCKKKVAESTKITSNSGKNLKKGIISVIKSELKGNISDDYKERLQSLMSHLDSVNFDSHGSVTDLKAKIRVGQWDTMPRERFFLAFKQWEKEYDED